MEIPRSIKFDFLLVIVGLASSYAPTYFGFNEINIVFSIFVTIVGFYVFIYEGPTPFDRGLFDIGTGAGPTVLIADINFW